MTKEEAIKILRHWGSGTPAIDRDCAVKMAIEALENPEPHWIPVTERLPKKSGEYTVTDHKGDVVRFAFITGSDSSRRYWYRCAKAWMPLPEPFKGVTE